MIELPETPTSPGISGYSEIHHHLAEVEKELGKKELFRQMAALCRRDLYFLLRFVLSTRAITDQEGEAALDHPWLFDRCREVQEEPNGCLDIWAREHWKTTIISYGLSIWDILNNPEITIGLFSHSRPLSKRLLRQIKVELELNDLLKAIFPDVLYEKPRTQAPKWGEDDGIVVRRRTNPAASTVEAWGLVDGQPVGKHFEVLVYDDVVTRESVTTPEMIAKVTEAWELSLNLGTQGGVQRYIGTRYHYADTYKTMMERGIVKPRIYPALEPPNIESGVPVLQSKEFIEKKHRSMSRSTFASQMLCDPKTDEYQNFDTGKIRRYLTRPASVRDGKNVYLLVDPANSKKRGSDYTVVMAVGLGADKNYYVLDIARDRMNLQERCRKVIDFHRLWGPVIECRYEEYGAMADTSYLEELMQRQNYHFAIRSIRQKVKKEDRLVALSPIVSSERLWLPQEITYRTLEGKDVELTSEFIRELEDFPVGAHDDLLDAFSLIDDNSGIPLWPMVEYTEKRDRYNRPSRPKYGWAGV